MKEVKHEKMITPKGREVEVKTITRQGEYPWRVIYYKGKIMYSGVYDLKEALKYADNGIDCEEYRELWARAKVWYFEGYDEEIEWDYRVSVVPEGDGLWLKLEENVSQYEYIEDDIITVQVVYIPKEVLTEYGVSQDVDPAGIWRKKVTWGDYLLWVANRERRRCNLKYGNYINWMHSLYEVEKVKAKEAK